MSNKVLASMPPGMVYTLRTIAHDPGAVVHGPMLKGLATRGLVRTTNRGHLVTWAGQKLLNHMEEE